MQMQVKLTAESFVSNTGQDVFSGSAIFGTFTPRAQRISDRHATHASTTLADIVVKMEADRSGVPAFTFYTRTSDDKPATSIEDLNGDSSTTGLLAFTPATATTLAESYQILHRIFHDLGGDANMQRTASNNVDSGAATGWDSAEASLYSTNSGTTWNSSGSSVEIAITGIVVVSAPTLSTDATLSDLELEDDSGTDNHAVPDRSCRATTTYTALTSSTASTKSPSCPDGERQQRDLRGSEQLRHRANGRRHEHHRVPNRSLSRREHHQGRSNGRGRLHRDLHGHGNPDTGRLRNGRHSGAPP